MGHESSQEWHLQEQPLSHAGEKEPMGGGGGGVETQGGHHKSSESNLDKEIHRRQGWHHAIFEVTVASPSYSSSSLP